MGKTTVNLKKFFPDPPPQRLPKILRRTLASRQSQEHCRKTVHEIAQSGSQLNILEQKRPALSERNGCCRRHAVIRPGERVRVAVWGSH